MNRTMRTLIFTIISLLSTIAVCNGGDLLVYEPFDYQPHNHEIMGRLEGRNGGLGFVAPWVDTVETGYALIYDKRGNQEDLYDGRWGQGSPNWDGVVDNLPTMGGYIGISDWDRIGAIHSTRKLAMSAGAMAKKSDGVLWLSAVWHFPEPNFHAPVGIALASKGDGFKERAVIMYGKADAIGVGNGRNFRKWKGNLTPMVWNKGDEVAGTHGFEANGSKDSIIILKFEFGETDKVSTWFFSEDQKMTEDAFNKNAASCSAAIDENTLEYLTIGAGMRGNAVDEIRIGTTFKSVISGTIPARQEVKIEKTRYDAKTDSYKLLLSSNPGEVYGIYLAEDAGGYKPCIAAAVEASKDKTSTVVGPFPSPRKGNGKLKFEIGLPDTIPPSIERVWGSGTSINLIFSETMLPTTSLSTAHYVVEQKNGKKVGVTSVKFDSNNGSLALTTDEALKPATAYTVTTRGLTDLTNNPLTQTSITLNTWDDDPKGIKVFILAGQSNMVGYGHSEAGHDNKAGAIGSLRHLAVNNAKYPEYDYSSLLVDPKQPATSKWKTRSDVKVWWRNGVRANLGGPVGKGDLGPPFRGGNERWFGPEYGFGQVIGDHYAKDDVLIIKAAWGGHKLVSDFRPPSAVAKRGSSIGASYQAIFNDAREVLQNLGTEFPEWKGRGYQIVGFAWHQGTSDKGPDLVANEYKHSLVDLISDVRAEFGKPELPFVIATTGMGYGGTAAEPPYTNYHPVERAQLWVAGVERPANVLTDDTRKYYEPPETSPRNQGFHWNQNARCYFRVGYGIGKNMVKVLGKRK